MFEKKDIIFSETLGVCKVAEITKLGGKNGEQVLYYGLRSVADAKKVSYIPVEHHAVRLRHLISYEQAKEWEREMPESFTEQQREEVAYVLSHPDV